LIKQIINNLQSTLSLGGTQMRKYYFLAFAFMFIASMAFAQSTGSVSGFVRDSLNNPISEAMVNLMPLMGGHHGGHHELYRAISDSTGAFAIANVDSGAYLAIAGKRDFGQATDSIVVVAGQNTEVNFVLIAEPPVVVEYGSVSGTVRDSLGIAVDSAMVHLTPRRGDNHPGGPGHMGHGYHMFTGVDGTFAFDSVEVGNYMAMAGKVLLGHAVDSLAVVANQNTVINFTLMPGGSNHHGGGHHGGGQHGDTMVVVDLTGWAIVVADSEHTHYYLDIDNNDTADFRLSFGPPDYNPNNGAQRPADGDSISISGGLIGYGEIQTVVVYTINGLTWREPGHGHGGHGGHGGGCPHPDSVIAIETAGIALVVADSNRTHYYLDTNYDTVADYILNFGPPDYNPGNGATRPENGDSVAIVGGLLDGPNALDVIIVYEINGQQWWRDPGDTTNLWPKITSSVDETELLPSTYLMANSYPNPFNPSAMIAFDLPSAGNVRVVVYDILGKEVANLADNYFSAGHHELQFTPAQKISSAIYFYRVIAGNEATVGKMIFLK
jgi:hypothetical protein